MVECVVKGAPPCRAAPFVGLSRVPLLSVTRLSPFVRAVRSPPSVTEAARYLRRLMPIMPSTAVKTAQSAMTVCGSIGGTSFRGCPGWRSTFSNSSRIPSLRGVLFCCGYTPKRATLPCTRSIVPRRADRLRRDLVRLDAFPAFRYTAILRPGGGTADASVSKTDIERCVGSNPTPGTTLSWKSPNNRIERTRSPSRGGVRTARSDAVKKTARRAVFRRLPEGACAEGRERPRKRTRESHPGHHSFLEIPQQLNRTSTKPLARW